MAYIKHFSNNTKTDTFSILLAGRFNFTKHLPFIYNASSMAAWGQMILSLFNPYPEKWKTCLFSKLMYVMNDRMVSYVVETINKVN